LNDILYSRIVSARSFGMVVANSCNSGRSPMMFVCLLATCVCRPTWRRLQQLPAWVATVTRARWQSVGRTGSGSSITRVVVIRPCRWLATDEVSHRRPKTSLYIVIRKTTTYAGTLEQPVQHSQRTLPACLTVTHNT